MKEELYMATFTFRFNVTGTERKKLVSAISQITGAEAKYLRMPSAAYRVDYFTIDKNGAVSFDDSADSVEIENLVALCAYPIMNSSLTNNIVLDSFGGSGSTLIACEQTGRICYTIELDERYADVIVKRYIEQKGSDTDVFLMRDTQKTAYIDVKKSVE